MRRALGHLYTVAAILAALCLLSIFLLMMAQSIGREFGLTINGADDITAWMTAATGFLALAATFKRGELIRVGLAIDKLRPRTKHAAEIVVLAISALTMAGITLATADFVYLSWDIEDVSQGSLPVMMWIPQLPMLAGMAILTVAIVEQLVIVIRGERPDYVIAGEDRMARGDFSAEV